MEELGGSPGGPNTALHDSKGKSRGSDSELVADPLERRRIEPACLACRRLKQKCDKKEPCQRCRKYTEVCEYPAGRKKRRTLIRPRMLGTKCSEKVVTNMIETARKKGKETAAKEENGFNTKLEKLPQVHWNEDEIKAWFVQEKNIDLLDEVFYLVSQSKHM